jgi:hypothetical protein
VLLFDLGDRSCALRVSSVRGLAECGPLRPVPGAPPFVAGLTEWRGNVVTVLDLSRLLGTGRGAGSARLIPLAPPYQQTALLVEARVAMGEIPATGRPRDEEDGAAIGPIEERFEHEGRVVDLIDPVLLLRGSERRSEERD